ncbi:MAG: thymidine phosphorylase, partial [Hyphomicrobiales bacterium]|nr:thymidine phosphorylase [Hyphomicrobiales bacterium]
LAPADKRLYAIRDITATVDSVDLITASILSKKLAAGLGSLILDVKCGSGAFMTSPEQARELAQSLVSVANGAGCRTAARITDMNQPLASAAGNAVETANAVDFLTGKAVDTRLWDITCTLGGDLLHLAGLASDVSTGRRQIETAFQSGAAAEHFGRMVSELGGPMDFIENSVSYLPKASATLDAPAGRTGYIKQIDPRAIGLAVIGLGGGRRIATDKIDHSVGFSRLLAKGAPVEANTPLGRVHAATPDAAEAAAIALREAYMIGDTAPEVEPLFRGNIAPEEEA